MTRVAHTVILAALLCPAGQASAKKGTEAAAAAQAAAAAAQAAAAAAQAAQAAAAGLRLAVPAEPATPAVPKEEAWRGGVPEAGPARPVLLPAFKSVTLKNGLVVLAPESRGRLPLVAFDLVTRGGAATDPAGLAGRASLLYGMLAEGAGKRDALAFSDALADLGASFGTAPDRDHGAVSISGLARNAEPMMALLADAVLRPRMEAKDFDRRKQQALAGLERSRSSPQGVAIEALPALIYGPGHPLGHAPQGTPESMAQLDLAAIKRAHAEVLGPAESALIAAGDISVEEAARLAEKHFGAWKQPAAPRPAITPVAPRKRAALTLIDFAGAPQTFVVVGRPLFGRGHEDEVKMTVLNELWGGSFSGRLNMNLREDKGYSYGAFSQVAFRQGVGVFVALSAIRADATVPGLQEMLGELVRLGPEPATEVEVAEAKSSIVLGLPGAFERTPAFAGAARAIFLYGLGGDYFRRVLGDYQRVTLDEVRRAARDHLDPSVMQVLLVGDAATLKPALEKAGLGPVEIRPRP